MKTFIGQQEVLHSKPYCGFQSITDCTHANHKINDDCKHLGDAVI